MQVSISLQQLYLGLLSAGKGLFPAGSYVHLTGFADPSLHAEPGCGPSEVDGVPPHLRPHSPVGR